MSLQIPAFAFLFPGGPIVNSLLATAYISLIPNIMLCFVPPHIQPTTLRTLVSFAVGGLLGDVFLHLLPHAFGGGHGHGGGGGHHHHHHHHGSFMDADNKQHVLVGLAIFIGFFFFFAMDKMMRMLNDGNGHCHDHGIPQHNQSTDVDLSNDGNIRHEGLRQRNKKNDGDDDTIIDHNYKTSTMAAVGNNNNTVKLTAYLNLLADFVHNLMDGLAMAASFYASPAIGATTAVAVFFHEIPHEIGDYALLLQSGFSKQKAMMAQFTTAVGALLGTMMGILIEEGMAVATHHHHSHKGLMGTRLQWADLVIPMTAGGFLYIASVGVIPDLLNDGHQRNKKTQVAMEFASMGVGMAVMAAIAWNEM